MWLSAGLSAQARLAEFPSIPGPHSQTVGVLCMTSRYRLYVVYPLPLGMGHGETPLVSGCRPLDYGERGACKGQGRREDCLAHICVCTKDLVYPQVRVEMGEVGHNSPDQWT